MPAPLLVVDAPFLLYRSYFALPDTIRGRDGQPVNALLGAVNNLLRVIVEISPRAVVTCFGAESAPYRVALYPGYHADRPPMPEPLAWQFEQAPALFAAFAWAVDAAAEYEADDLLGSYSQTEAEAGGETLLLTGDRDMYQCVGDHTRVLYLKQGAAGFEIVDAAEVEHRYGIGPSQVVDLIALRGDPSDGLPGAPGIGQKTAADLLRRFGTLEGALAAAHDADPAGRGLRPRLAATLREHAPALRAYREIAALRRLDVTLPADMPTDLPNGAAAASALGMGKLAARLEAASSIVDLR